MIDRELTLAGPSYIAYEQNFYNGDEFVELRSVPVSDRAACAVGRFATPAGEWKEAQDKLRDHHIVVVRGVPGSGRRTAALKMLSSVSTMVHDLRPAWDCPRTTLLPSVKPGEAYLLDMTEPTEQTPEDDFGKHLVEWAQQRSIYLAVTTTDAVWSGRWAAGARLAVAELGSPNARELVVKELEALCAGDRSEVLDAVAFREIWASEPKAENACRLARLIGDPVHRTPEDIAGEYGNWRTWIDESMPANLGVRSLIWSAAFCDGGKRKSLLSMAEDLRRLAGRPRAAADILMDEPASKRIKDAKIELVGDGIVRLSPGQHGLPQAVCRYLWEEYEGQRDILTNWLKVQMAQLPREDAHRVAQAVLDLVIHFRDDKLLVALRDTLADKQPPLAIQIFSTAAINRRSGPLVRNRLYSWLKNSSSRNLIDVLTAVCGGQFGIKEPDMALTRLRLCAQKSPPDSWVLADAMGNLITHHPEKVLSAIAAWFSTSTWLNAGINAFLALASTDHGAALLCKRAAPDSSDPDFASTLARYFDRAIDVVNSRHRAIFVATAWGTHAEHGELDTEITTKVFVMAFAPHLKDDIIPQFPESVNYNSYWGRVYREAIVFAENIGTIDLGQEPAGDVIPIPVSSPDPNGNQPDTDGGPTIDSEDAPEYPSQVG